MLNTQTYKGEWQKKIEIPLNNSLTVEIPGDGGLICVTSFNDD